MIKNTQILATHNKWTHPGVLIIPSLLGGKTQAPPALSPNSSLQTEHLHPTKRYKNRRDQGEFESAFEFVKVLRHHDN